MKLYQMLLFFFFMSCGEEPGPVLPSYVQVTPSSMTLQINQNQKATAVVHNYPYGGAHPTITWTPVKGYFTAVSIIPNTGREVTIVGMNIGIDTLRASIHMHGVEDGFIAVTVTN